MLSPPTGCSWVLMSIAKTVKQYLDDKHIIYSVQQVQHFDSPLQAAVTAGIAPRSLYYPVVLRDPFGLMMAILPASHELDYTHLGALLNRKVDLAFHTQLSSVFSDCQPGMIPPIGEPYGIRTIIDAGLETPEEVYMVAGDNSRIIKLSRKDFLMTQANAWLASDFSKPIEQLEEAGDNAEVMETLVEKNHYIRHRIEQITELPPMPEMATKIVELQAEPMAEIADLVAILEMDPGLAAQVMRYARAPFFGCGNQIESLYDAVTRVLGFDAAMNMALGVAMARPFRISLHGPIGLESFWRDAVYSASLYQAVAKLMPRDGRPRLGLCYLGGLLHNFGYLILGHFFREEFIGLSDAMLGQPDVPMETLEQQYLGIDHSEIGAWLLSAWQLPEEIVTMVREHHTSDYSGPHGNYVYLAQLVDIILANIEAGSAPTEGLSQSLLASLGVDEVEVMRVVDTVLEDTSGLDDMIAQLAA